MVTSKLSPKDKAADLRLKREYYPLGGLAEYNKVLKFQGGNCAICKTPVPTGKPRLSVDHCHTTGLLRGLLCWKCNRAIGVFRDNVELLIAAAEYLKVPPVSAVFGTSRFTAPGRVGSKKRAKALKLLVQAAKSI
jgi:hypothetical protein